MTQLSAEFVPERQAEYVAPAQPGFVAPEPAGFVVGYSPVTMDNRCVMLAKALRRRVLSMMVSVLVWSAIWWIWFRPAGGDRWGSIWWLLIGYGFSLVVIAQLVVQLVLARRALKRAPRGDAMRLTPRGLVLYAVDGGRIQMEWSQVASVCIEGHEFGSGPRLRAKIPPAQGKRRAQLVWDVPLYYLDSLPGTVDGALRAFSQGDVALDVRGMDRFW